MKLEIIEKIKKGEINNFISIPKHIRMIFSDIFIFDDENLVLKIYSFNKNFFNSKDEFKKFIKDDFYFNKKNSEDIYLELVEVGIKNGEVVFLKPIKECDSDFGENLVILMRKLDEEDNLLNLFLNKKLDLDDFYKIGQYFGNIKKQFFKKEYIEEEFNSVYGKYMSELDKKLKKTPVGFLGSILRYLKKYLYENKIYFNSIRLKDYRPNLDSNLGNLFYSNDGGLKIIDSYSVKNEWKYFPIELNVFILGADILFIYGKEEYSMYKNGVSETLNMDWIQERFYLLFGAMISYPYLYYLGSQDKKYRKLVWVYQKKLKKYFFDK